MTDIKELLSKLETQRVEYVDFVKRQQEEMLRQAEGLFAGLFEAFPFAEAVVWTQYTPGFNDGEPCTFGVHDFYVMGEGYLADDDVQGEYPEELDYVIPLSEPWRYAEWKAGETIEEYYIDNCKTWDNILETYGLEVIDQLSQVLSGLESLPDSIYESFGEGLVVASREGIDVYEYDCGY